MQELWPPRFRISVTLLSRRLHMTLTEAFATPAGLWNVSNHSAAARIKLKVICHNAESDDGSHEEHKQVLDSAPSQLLTLGHTSCLTPWKSRQSFGWPRNSPSFTEDEGSFLWTQEPISHLYHDPSNNIFLRSILILCSQHQLEAPDDDRIGRNM
jgi:hypothetical protein